MTDLVIVYDRTGTPLAELPVAIVRDYRAERTVQVAKGSFAISANHPKATREILRQCNYVVVQNDIGIPTWGGMIWGDITLQNGEIVVPLRAAEWMLGMRVTDDEDFTGTIPGMLFRNLLAAANTAEPLPISDDYSNVIVDTSAVVEGSWRTGTIYDACNVLANAAGYYWGLDPVVPAVGGRLEFKARFRPKSGIRFIRPLIQDSNFMNLEIKEISVEMANQISVFARMSGWTEPVVATAQDIESQAVYGKIQSTITNLTIKSVAGAQAHADAQIRKRAWPYLRIAGTVTGSPFPVAGDLVPVSLNSNAGIYARNGAVNCRVKSSRYNPSDNTLTLLVEEER